MAFRRTAIPFFELSNAAYASSTISFFGVDDTTNERLATLITLYSAITGTATAANPYTLDSEGKFSSPVYAEERFIALLTAVDGQQHETGIWAPALSTADVAAAAASATAAAASATVSSTGASSATVSAASAAASAAAAAATVGSVNVTVNDPTTAVLNTKLDVSGLATKAVSPTTASQVLTISVPAASDVQALAKTSVTTALTPGNLAALNGDAVTTGLVRFATAAEVTTGSVSTAAVTPAGIANTLTKVGALAGTYVTMASGTTTAMTKNLAYSFKGVTSNTKVNLPTTLGSGEFNIVNMHCTTAGLTLTVGPTTISKDGTSEVDTFTTTGGAGPILKYYYTAADTVRSELIGGSTI